MALETGTFISDLAPTNPISTDKKGQGDDHLRLIKSVLQLTFPGASKAFYFPTTQTKSADFSAALTDMNKTFLVDTTAGAVAATLPTLASGDAGWECFFVKTNTGTNPMFIMPPSGTIQSGEVAGLSKTRRCVPGHRTRVFWTGTAFIAERVIRNPVGSVVEFAGTSLPVGYEWPNGTSLSSSANYPDYNSVRGGLTTPDRRGRVAAGKDDMGGVSANRLTAAVAQGLNGDNFEATGGEETHALITAELAAHSHTITDTGHTHTLPFGQSTVTGGAGAPYPVNGASAYNTGNSTTGISINNTGSGTAHNVVQPTIIENFILVVE